MVRENGTTCGVLLKGNDPHNMVNAELAHFIPGTPGVYFVPEHPTQTAHLPRIVGCSELLKTSRECTRFMLPNGGYKDNGEAEFIDYATGKTSMERIAAFCLLQSLFLRVKPKAHKRSTSRATPSGISLRCRVATLKGGSCRRNWKSGYWT